MTASHALMTSAGVALCFGFTKLGGFLLFLSAISH